MSSDNTDVSLTQTPESPHSFGEDIYSNIIDPTVKAPRPAAASVTAHPQSLLARPVQTAMVTRRDPFLAV